MTGCARKNNHFPRESNSLRGYHVSLDHSLRKVEFLHFEASESFQVDFMHEKMSGHKPRKYHFFREKWNLSEVSGRSAMLLSIVTRSQPQIQNFAVIRQLIEPNPKRHHPFGAYR